MMQRLLDVLEDWFVSSVWGALLLSLAAGAAVTGLVILLTLCWYWGGG